MPTFNATNPVAIGLATKKDHFDRLWDNVTVVRGGGLAVASQAAHDFLPASSTEQLTRVAAVAGKSPRFKLDSSGWEMVSYAGPQYFRGLRLRTHYDNDLAANQVVLHGLDEVVMSDGLRYTGLTLPLVGDISASGAGGLDTGSRTASNWYSVHLIGKSSTQDPADLALLIHREKTWTLDQSQTTQDTYGLLRDGTTVKLAQSFQPGTTGLLEMVDLGLLKLNSPTGRVWVTVEADTSGSPSGTPLATSDKLDVSQIAPALQWVRFPFRAPVSLTSGTTYHLVLQGDFTPHASNNINWYGKGGGSSYANGAWESYNGSVWATTSTSDFEFKTYVTANDAALTFPTGYDQSCKLGYVYNNGSNILTRFQQIERRCIPLEQVQVGAFAVATPSVSHIAAYVPPTPIVVSLYANGDTANQYIQAGGVPDGTFWSSVWRFGGIASFITRAANENQSLVLVTDFQGFYPSCYASGTATFYVDWWEWLR